MDKIKSPSEKLIDLLEAYGIAVRAGAITPCLQDENQFRKLMGLEPAPAEVVADWSETKGVRKPVTLQADNSDNSNSDNDDSNSENDNPNSDGFRAKPETKKPRKGTSNA